MNCYQSRPGFELVSSCPFPTTITITPRAPRAPPPHYGIIILITTAADADNNDYDNDDDNDNDHNNERVRDENILNDGVDKKRIKENSL